MAVAALGGGSRDPKKQALVEDDVAECADSAQRSTGFLVAQILVCQPRRSGRDLAELPEKILS